MELLHEEREVANTGGVEDEYLRWVTLLSSSIHVLGPSGQKAFIARESETVDRASRWIFGRH